MIGSEIASRYIVAMDSIIQADAPDWPRQVRVLLRRHDLVMVQAFRAVGGPDRWFNAHYPSQGAEAEPNRAIEEADPENAGNTVARETVAIGENAQGEQNAYREDDAAASVASGEASTETLSPSDPNRQPVHRSRRDYPY